MRLRRVYGPRLRGYGSTSLLSRFLFPRLREETSNCSDVTLRGELLRSAEENRINRTFDNSAAANRRERPAKTK